MTLFENVNLYYVLIGTVLFGFSSGVLGCFAFLRKRSLIGDALAHAALPGVCIAYLISGAKIHALFILGAIISGLIASMVLHSIVRYSRIKEDAAIGLVLSVFFGIGIMLLTYIQHLPMGNQSGLDKFLFGQAASLVGEDLYLFGGLALAVICVVMLAYKEFKLIAFDPGFAETIGIRVRGMDILLTLLIVTVVTAGLQAVGVVLMAAMLITPASAARQWTDRLWGMLLLSGIFGALSGATGAIASALAPRMPTGPWIVVAVTTIFAVSILFAPRRGMVARWWHTRRNTVRINQENILKTLYRLSEDAPTTPPTLDMLRRYRHLSVRRALRLLARLQRQGLAVQGNRPDEWTLTAMGREQAEKLVRRHRLWEVYLTQYLQLGKTHVHADAEEIEHILTPELEAELESLLNYPTTDPHHRPIPYPRGRPS